MGQIHLDTAVKVVGDNSESVFSNFDIAKTFAWGGIYGGVTTMEDIEQSFAEGVALAVTGQQEQTQKQIKKAETKGT